MICPVACMRQSDLTITLVFDSGQALFINLVLQLLGV